MLWSFRRQRKYRTEVRFIIVQETLAFIYDCYRKKVGNKSSLKRWIWALWKYGRMDWTRPLILDPVALSLSSMAEQVAVDNVLGVPIPLIYPHFPFPSANLGVPTGDWVQEARLSPTPRELLTHGWWSFGISSNSTGKLVRCLGLGARESIELELKVQSLCLTDPFTPFELIS